MVFLCESNLATVKNLIGRCELIRGLEMVWEKIRVFWITINLCLGIPSFIP